MRKAGVKRLVMAMMVMGMMGVPGENVRAEGLETYRFVDAGVEMWTEGDADVRDLPCEDGSVVGKIEAGEKVWVEKQCVETGWYSVEWEDGSVAFVSDEFLGEGEDDDFDKSEICQTDGSVNGKWKDMVNDELEVLPEEVLEAFRDEGWKMYVTDMDLDDTFFGGRYGSVLGLTSYREKTIYVEDRRVAVIESPVHEMGHFIDWYLGKGTGTLLSGNEEFAEIYRKEADSFIEGLNVGCMMNQMEGFAEGVYRYYDDPETMKECAPGMYGYIEECLNSFGQERDLQN